VDETNRKAGIRKTRQVTSQFIAKVVKIISHSYAAATHGADNIHLPVQAKAITKPSKMNQACVLIVFVHEPIRLVIIGSRSYAYQR
jgi:hypothetical protein